MAKKKKGAEEEGAAPEETEKGGGGKKLGLVPIIVLAVAILGGGAMAGGLVGGGSGTAEASTQEAEPEATPTPVPLGTLVQLDALTLNLADGRFLKVSVALELGPEIVEEPATAPIYDAVIATFNTMTVEILTDPGQREATKATLLESLEPIYGEDIVDVYYTEFVMQ